MKRLLFVVAALSGVAFASPADAGGGCHGNGEKEAAGATVELSMNCMSPRVLHVPAGASVTFVNRDPVDHNLFGDGWFVDALGKGATHERAFTEGTHVYACTLHPGMVGAVVAGDQDGVKLAASTVAPVGNGSSNRWVFAGLVGLAIGVGLTALRYRLSR